MPRKKPGETASTVRKDQGKNPHAGASSVAPQLGEVSSVASSADVTVPQVDAISGEITAIITESKSDTPAVFVTAAAEIANSDSGGGAKAPEDGTCNASSIARVCLYYPPTAYESGWWAAVIPEEFRHKEISEGLNYLLLSLIRNALCMHCKMTQPKQSSVKLFSSTHSEKDFTEIIPAELLQRVAEIIIKEIHSNNSNPKLIWFSIVNNIFEILQENKGVEFIARLRSAFHEAFEVFGTASNAFAVNTTDLQSHNLKTILASPLKSLKLNVLFYLLSLYTSYEMIDINKRNKFINAVKNTLNQSTASEQAYETALGRVEILKQLRAEHPDKSRANTITQYARSILAYAVGYDSSGNFGVILTKFIENKFNKSSESVVEIETVAAALR